MHITIETAENSGQFCWHWHFLGSGRLEWISHRILLQSTPKPRRLHHWIYFLGPAKKSLPLRYSHIPEFQFVQAVQHLEPLKCESHEIAFSCWNKKPNWLHSLCVIFQTVDWVPLNLVKNLRIWQRSLVARLITVKTSLQWDINTEVFKVILWCILSYLNRISLWEEYPLMLQYG